MSESTVRTDHPLAEPIQAALARVNDPEIKRPITELGMVDSVDVDADGYVTIKGRAKRFAKIGGEMVSLTAVEGIAGAVWPEQRHAVVSIPDSRKGEKLVLVTDHAAAEVAPLAEWARENGAPELIVPKKIVKVAEVPVLGTGKTDDKGEKVAFTVKTGDRVLISKYGGTEVKYAGEEYLVLSARDVLAVIEK